MVPNRHANFAPVSVSVNWQRVSIFQIASKGCRAVQGMVRFGNIDNPAGGVEYRVVRQCPPLEVIGAGVLIGSGGIAEFTADLLGAVAIEARTVAPATRAEIETAYTAFV